MGNQTGKNINTSNESIKDQELYFKISNKIFEKLSRGSRLRADKQFRIQRSFLNSYIDGEYDNFYKCIQSLSSRVMERNSDCFKSRKLSLIQVNIPRIDCKKLVDFDNVLKNVDGGLKKEEEGIETNDLDQLNATPRKGAIAYTKNTVQNISSLCFNAITDKEPPRGTNTYMKKGFRSSKVEGSNKNIGTEEREKPFESPFDTIKSSDIKEDRARAQQASGLNTRQLSSRNSNMNHIISNAQLNQSNISNINPKDISRSISKTDGSFIKALTYGKKIYSSSKSPLKPFSKRSSLKVSSPVVFYIPNLMIQDSSKPSNIQNRSTSKTRTSNKPSISRIPDSLQDFQNDITHQSKYSKSTYSQILKEKKNKLIQANLLREQRYQIIKSKSKERSVIEDQSVTSRSRPISNNERKKSKESKRTLVQNDFSRELSAIANCNEEPVLSQINMKSKVLLNQLKQNKTVSRVIPQQEVYKISESSHDESSPKLMHKQSGLYTESRETAGFKNDLQNYQKFSINSKAISNTERSSLGDNLSLSKKPSDVRNAERISFNPEFTRQQYSTYNPSKNIFDPLPEEMQIPNESSQTTGVYVKKKRIIPKNVNESSENEESFQYSDKRTSYNPASTNQQCKEFQEQLKKITDECNEAESQVCSVCKLTLTN